MVPFKNLKGLVSKETSAGNPKSDRSYMNESPQTYKTDRENNPFSPALMEKMKRLHVDKFGQTVRPYKKPAKKRK